MSKEEISEDPAVIVCIKSNTFYFDNRTSNEIIRIW